ncbi:ATP-binding protein [Kitasatospora sp. NPDC093679]|uniref:ATP-binding protein n=1 Tax=Kitasatospora sp. NPDC093679 TaxID=3154983 RepID=UPI00344AA7F7
MRDGVDFTRHALTDWHLTGRPAAGDAVLAAAELLANAAQHAGGPLALDLRLRPGGLRIAVTDANPVPPHLIEPHRPETPHGHGLVIVDRVTEAWGATPAGDGKTVWADLPLTPATDPGPEPDRGPEPDPGRARRAALARPDPLFDG